jgi:hypothetical protein
MKNSNTDVIDYNVVASVLIHKLSSFVTLLLPFVGAAEDIIFLY